MRNSQVAEGGSSNKASPAHRHGISFAFRPCRTTEGVYSTSRHVEVRDFSTPFGTKGTFRA